MEAAKMSTRAAKQGYVKPVEYSDDQWMVFLRSNRAAALRLYKQNIRRACAAQYEREINRIDATISDIGKKQ